MRTIPPVFNTNRMLVDYTEDYYVSALRQHDQLTHDSFEASKKLAQWKQDMAKRWSQVRIMNVQAGEEGELAVGDSFEVQARVHLGPIDPNEVAVELFHGAVDPHGHIAAGQAEAMACQGETSTDGTYRFVGAIPCIASGQHGYAVRIVPRNPHLPTPYSAGLILWG
jgi:starch phosphorylase